MSWSLPTLITVLTITRNSAAPKNSFLDGKSEGVDERCILIEVLIFSRHEGVEKMLLRTRGCVHGLIEHGRQRVPAG
jgi:hypothetical protein